MTKSYIKNRKCFACCIRGVTFQSSLVTRCKITRCKIRSLLVAEVAHCKNSLVTRCRSCSLQKNIVTRCKIRSLLVAEVARCKKSLVARCGIPSILIAKHHSSLKQSPAGIIVCLKSTKLDESFFQYELFPRENIQMGKISTTTCSESKK